MSLERSLGIKKSFKEPTQKKFCVMSSKKMHSGALHGFAANGGEIPLSDNLSISFIKLNDSFVSVQVRWYETGYAPLKQTYVRTKKVVVKSDKKEKKTESFEVKGKTGTKSLWD
jgi:hypothetical protein